MQIVQKVTFESLIDFKQSHRLAFSRFLDIRGNLGNVKY